MRTQDNNEQLKPVSLDKVLFLEAVIYDQLKLEKDSRMEYVFFFDG